MLSRFSNFLRVRFNRRELSEMGMGAKGLRIIRVDGASLPHFDVESTEDGIAVQFSEPVDYDGLLFYWQFGSEEDAEPT